jgi:hypothetical protein
MVRDCGLPDPWVASERNLAVDSSAVAAANVGEAFAAAGVVTLVVHDRKDGWGFGVFVAVVGMHAAAVVGPAALEVPVGLLPLFVGVVAEESEVVERLDLEAQLVLVREEFDSE